MIFQAGVFSARDKLQEVREYFGHMVSAMQKNEKLRLLNSMPPLDFESPLQSSVDFTPETAMKNPKILNALLQYEKDTRHTIFAMRIPDETSERKKFIHCQGNLKKFREYLYVNHDILVSELNDLINALYALYIFKLDISILTNTTEEYPATIEKGNNCVGQVRKYYIYLSFH